MKKEKNFITDSRIEEKDFDKIRNWFIQRGLGINEMEEKFKHKYTVQQIRTALKEILKGYGNWVEIFRQELHWDKNKRD